MWSSVPAAHPRERGEKKLSPHFPSPLVGSPPQTWGKAEVPVGAGLPSGLTPAGAGKSRHDDPSLKPFRDHPHGCGEKKWIYTQPPCAQGSPPQVRGKGPIHRNVKKSWRITPADAGKRHRLQGVGADAQDHPRGCGEKKASAPWSTTVGGSPPRVRGKGVAPIVPFC